MMVPIEIGQTDDVGFLERVNRIVNGTIASAQTPQVHVVKIDNWFGMTWLRFSGKILGALGIRNKPLTLPPFVANRVLSEHHYVWNAQSRRYDLRELDAMLHGYHTGHASTRRFLSRLAPGTAFFWYSGNSKANGRGSIMAYVPRGDDYWTWYIELVRAETWSTGKVKGISTEQLEGLQSPIADGG